MKVIKFLDGYLNDAVGIYQDKPFTGIVKNEYITCYFKNGKKHKLDGPAAIYPHGDEVYYLNGKMYTEEDFRREIQRRGLGSPEYFKNFL